MNDICINALQVHFLCNPINFWINYCVRIICSHSVISFTNLQFRVVDSILN